MMTAGILNAFALLVDRTCDVADEALRQAERDQRRHGRHEEGSAVDDWMGHFELGRGLVDAGRTLARELAGAADKRSTRGLP